MRLIAFCAAFLLASCAATPQKVVTEVKQVEVRVPVRVVCLKPDEIPAKPQRLAKAEHDVTALAASAVAELRAWEVYYARADALMRGCTKDD